MHDTARELADDTTADGAGLSALVEVARFAEAVELARVGRYREAEQVMASATPRARAAPSHLDLSARMLAQQGRLPEAAALWQQALGLAPGTRDFQAALARLARTHLPRTRRVRLLLAALAVVVLAAAGFAALRVLREPDADATSSPNARSAPLASAAAAGASDAALASHLSVPGVSVRVQQGGLVVTFDAGVFTRDTITSANADRLLTELAQRLESRAGRLAVEVTGCTDARPMPAHRRYRDNAALGVARAVSVVERLRISSGVPAHLLTVRAAPDAKAPCPADVPGERARSRTVTVRVVSLP